MFGMVEYIKYNSTYANILKNLFALFQVLCMHRYLFSEHHYIALQILN